jgi:type II restriction enzyme
MKKTDKEINKEDLILKKVEDGLRIALRNKLKSYDRETSYMPFQEAILGKKNTSIYSFGISISTWLGQNRKGGYEEITRILAEASGSEVHLQYKIPYSISKNTENKIYEIYTSIKRGETSPNADTLAKQIKKFTKLKKGIHQDSIVDVFIKDKDENLFFIDISSPKSNMKEAAALKLKILNWTAIGYANYKNAKSINAFIALPYNPYHPKDYSRFSTKIFDKSKDILVQDNFWDKIAGFKVYDKLIDTIQKVGSENMEDLLKKVDGL